MLEARITDAYLGLTLLLVDLGRLVPNSQNAKALKVI